MECPHCNAALKTTDLLGRKTNPAALWYELTGSELHCPRCDARLTYAKRPQVVAAGGCIIYAGILGFNLLYPDNPYQLASNVTGLVLFVVGMLYWHRNKTLIPVK